MSNTLFVIGNGFDLHHEIPSRYDDFREFLSEKDKDLLNLIKKYLPLYEDKLWRDFEAALANLDKDSVENYALNYLMSYSSDEWSDSGHHDYQYEIDKIVTALTDSLKYKLSEWIFEIDLSNYNKKLHFISPDSHYLTFNYTRTLQLLYGVPDENIFHIHGKSESPNSSLVLGHGDNPIKQEKLSRYDADKDIRILQGEQSIAEYCKLSYKQTDKIINDNKDFFIRLSQIDKVTILGHSMSDVDMPYFKRIVQSTNPKNTVWQISYFEDSDKIRFQQQFKKLGIKADMVCYAKIENIDECNRLIHSNKQQNLFN
jgi:hypothetical protein